MKLAGGFAGRLAMLEFLKSIFGENIKAASYEYPVETPVYIRDNYDLQLLLWDK